MAQKLKGTLSFIAKVRGACRTPVPLRAHPEPRDRCPEGEWSPRWESLPDGLGRPRAPHPAPLLPAERRRVHPREAGLQVALQLHLVLDHDTVLQVREPVPATPPTSTPGPVAGPVRAHPLSCHASLRSPQTVVRPKACTAHASGVPLVVSVGSPALMCRQLGPHTHHRPGSSSGRHVPSLWAGEGQRSPRSRLVPLRPPLLAGGRPLPLPASSCGRPHLLLGGPQSCWIRSHPSDLSLPSPAL